jgi:ABC-type uncharacterized transport system substrate-binding protein
MLSTRTQQTISKLRRGLIGVLLLTLLSSGVAKAENAKVIVIVSRSAGPYSEALSGLQTSLDQSIEVFNMKGDLRKGEQLLRNCTGQKEHVVVTIGTEAMLATKTLMCNIPLVYTMILKPLSTDRPKTTSVLIKLSITQQLEKIQSLFPEAKRIGVLYNPEISSQQIQAAGIAMGDFGFQLFANAVHSRNDIPGALTSMTKNNVDVLWLVIDKTIVNPMALKIIIQHSWDQKLPLVGLSQNHVKGGALLALAADYRDIGKQTATCVTTYLAGNVCEKEIAPRKIIVYVNSRTLKHMGQQTLSKVPDMVILP